MHEIFMINVTGQDQPGVTRTLTQALAQYNVNILDIGQAVIHDSLSLGILVEIPRGAESAPVLKDVLFKMHEIGAHVRFQPISQASYEQWLSDKGKQGFIITLLARKVTAEQISRVAAIVAENQLSIDNIDRLSGRVPLEGQDINQSNACVEFLVRGEPPDLERMRAQFLNVASDLGVDIAFQKDTPYRRNRRLVVFDMDSTLIETEVIDELAKVAGVEDQVSAITERAMRGELDFTESFRERVGLLAGLDESVLSGIADRLPLTEGAEDLIATLKALGYKTAILSGGFTYFGEVLRRRLGLDYVYANELEVENGEVTGRVVGRVVDGNRKAALLQEIADEEGIRLDQVIAVGDGANDLPMLATAGLGIAFRAKPIVQENAEHAISALGLDSILYLLGVRDRDREELADRPGAG